jgi:hypothetical protein
MGKKVIKLGLSTHDIDGAIKELDKYKNDFLKKVNIYQKRLADEIGKLAERGFASSRVDDIVGGGSRSAEVSVNVNHNGNISLVIAKGKDAVWCEFGAGVYHNGSAGSSPHPRGGELGLTIGSYGDGHGKQDVWGYYETPGDPDTLVLTHGTEATMPMYNAVRTIVPLAVKIAREVFA